MTDKTQDNLHEARQKDTTMRLICPNCGAQYEVAEDVIPENGRDVQCSNCGHTWFENPGASAAMEDEESYETEGGIPQGWEASFDPDEQTEDLHYGASDRDNLDALHSDEDRLSPAPTPPGVQDQDPPRRAPLDPSITDILRQEAAREEAARSAERETGLESQGDLGLEDVTSGTEAQREKEARDRMSRLKGEEPSVATAVAATVAGARKELLPDIEEINSTLRPSADHAEGQPLPQEIEDVQRRGFRFGFLSVLGLIIIAALIYLFADQIADALPVLADLLASYVNAVDSLRIWLDVKIQGLLTILAPPEN